MQNRKIEILGALMDLGASRRGVSLGPAAIRFAGIVEGLRAMGLEVDDLGDVIFPPEGKSLENMRNYEQVVEMNRKIYEKNLEILKRGNFPVLLGGDHSIATGSVMASSKHFGKIGLIWVDAHGDWNNEESTETGNMHGMSFSAACGGGPACMADFGQGPVYVDPRNCVQIGARDIDPKERERMLASGITVFAIDKIDKFGIRSVMEQAIEIASAGTAGIHLSYDVDAISPEFAPGTGTTVHSGLTVREAFTIAEMLAESKKLIAMDLVEVNPILDERNRTASLGSELVQSALGKAVF